MSRHPAMNESAAKEVAKPGYYERARQRAQRRKSPWNIILVPLVIGGIWLSLNILWFVMWHIHTAVYPGHDGVAFRQVFRGGKTVPFFLMFFPLLFASVPLGFMLGNCIAWCIPPARKTFEREAKGVKHASFRSAQRGLWMIGKFVIPVCLLLSLIGALTMRNVK